MDINHYIAKETDNNLYKNLNDNVKTQLIKYFEKFATKIFEDITNECELYNESKRYTDGKHFQEYIDKKYEQFEKMSIIANTKDISNCYAFGCLDMKDSTDGLYLVFDENDSRMFKIKLKM